IPQARGLLLLLGVRLEVAVGELCHRPRLRDSTALGRRVPAFRDGPKRLLRFPARLLWRHRPMGTEQKLAAPSVGAVLGDVHAAPAGMHTKPEPRKRVIPQVEVGFCGLGALHEALAETSHGPLRSDHTATNWERVGPRRGVGYRRT